MRFKNSRDLLKTCLVAILSFGALIATPPASARAIAAAVTSPATDITFHGAILNGSVTHSSSNYTAVFAVGTKSDLSDPVFDYSGSFSNDMTLYLRMAVGPNGGGTSNISFDLNNWTPTGPGSELLPETTYYFRAGIQDGPDDPNCLWLTICYVWGPTLSFTTRAAVGPVATTGDASMLGADTALITGTATANDSISSVYVEYSESANLSGSITTPSSFVPSGSTQQSLSFSLSGLSPETTYHYRVVASNRFQTSLGEIKSFSTTPPIGISINAAANYTTSKSVLLSVSWPVGASSMTVSNDGGFRAPTAKVLSLSNLISWELDDSVKGIYTKVVYIRFGGPGIDSSRTYFDDVILDTTAPIIESSSGSVSGSDSLNVNLRATDDITGVDEVQISGSGGSTVTQDYATSLTIPLSEIDLSRTITGFGSEGRRSALASSSVRVRVSDAAGNWSSWTSISVSGVTSVGRFGTTSPSKVSVKRVKIAGATTFDNRTTGLPQTGIGAVALNVTAVEGYDDKGYGFVTTYPCDSPSTPAPNSSNLNFSGGQTIPNAVIAPVSADGYICFSVTGNTDLLVDAAGYFPTGPGFTSLTEPKRLIDTRSS